MLIGKKLVSALIATVLVVGLCPSPSFAAPGEVLLTAGAALTTQDESDTNGNPYPKYNDYEGGQIACTWYVWDYVYRNLGIRLPGTWGQGDSWGDAKSWYAKADADLAYEVGPEPRARSIAVYDATSSNRYGHVEFVTAANGSNMTVNTGGYAGDASWPNPPGIREGWEKTGIVGRNSLIGFIYLVQENPLTVTARDMSLKAGSVKGAAKAVSLFRALDAVGAVTFEDAGSSGCLTITSEGKVKVAKGTPAGTYTAKAVVRASGDARYKEGSKAVEARVQVVFPPPTPNPMFFKATARPGGFEASWRNVKRASAYEIAYATARDGAPTWKLAVAGGSASSKAVTGLRSGTGYAVKLRAFAEAVDGKRFYSGWCGPVIVQTKAEAYGIAFKANGGKGAMPKQVVARGDTFTLPANKFSRAGYTFAGWNTKADGTGNAYKDEAKVKNLAKASGTITLYAQWKALKENAYVKLRMVSMMNSATIEGVRYWLESYSLNGGSTYRINATKNGSTITLASNVSSFSLTNGRHLFYSARLGVKQYVKELGDSLEMCSAYMMDLTTGKKRKLATGPKLTLFDCDGDYLYCGPYKGLLGADLYALNLTTFQKTYMINGVKDATCSYGYVVTAPHHNVGINCPIYSFKTGGKGKKKIATAMEVRVIKKRVYYIVVGDGNNHPYPNSYRKYYCSLRGKNKKAVTGWDAFSNVSFSHDLSQP